MRLELINQLNECVSQTIAILLLVITFIFVRRWENYGWEKNTATHASSIGRKVYSLFHSKLRVRFALRIKSKKKKLTEALCRILWKRMRTCFSRYNAKQCAIICKHLRVNTRTIIAFDGIERRTQSHNNNRIIHLLLPHVYCCSKVHLHTLRVVCCCVSGYMLSGPAGAYSTQTLTKV